MGYLTQQDRQNFGDELIDLAQRAAAQTLEPELQRLERQNAELHNRLVQQGKRAIDQALDSAVPNWREINSDPRWLEWLSERDVLSRIKRQELLNEAVARGDSARVIRFFQGFISEITGAAPLGPGHPRPAAATGQRVYSRDQITKMAALRRQGKIDDQAWARWENEMVAAGREGRIVGALDPATGLARSVAG